MEIIFKIRETREKRGITIRQLARMSGISKSQISAIERGDSMPTILTMCQLAAALHVRAEDLYEYR